MTIDPTGKSTPAPCAPSRIRAAHPSEGAGPKTGRSGVEATTPSFDRAELSADARALSGQGASSPSGLGPARVRAIVDRMNSGFYNQPQVLDRVAERISIDPEVSATE